MVDKQKVLSSDGMEKILLPPVPNSNYRRPSVVSFLCAVWVTHDDGEEPEHCSYPGEERYTETHYR